ncbi:MAG: restriction endonuclease subunit S [Candidatus Levyibacteriota bacterium]
MVKNNISFLSIIEPEIYIMGVWDPYFYEHSKEIENLGKLVKITRLKSVKKNYFLTPIEYRNITKDWSFVFKAQEDKDNIPKSYTSAPENSLLFGTMRAYLGNVIVTPKSKWLKKKELVFPTKSEFLQILPKDELVYFWWFYLKSELFLKKLPLGGGGTRPRLSAEMLAKIPVSVPDLIVRKEIDKKLSAVAKQEWMQYTRTDEILIRYKQILQNEEINSKRPQGPKK